MNDTKDVSPEVSKHMAELGKKGGATNKKKGKAYFQWVRSHGKTRPVKKNDKSNT